MFFCCPTQKRSQEDVACGKTKVRKNEGEWVAPSDWIFPDQADRLLRRPNGAFYDVIFPNLAVRVVKTALYLRVSDPGKGQMTDNQLVREQSKRTVPVPIPDLDWLCTLTL